MDIIVTDLTRFSNDDIVCTAGICLENNTCVRPMPYIAKSECHRLNILPGAKLSGNFERIQGTRPHAEDHNYDNLCFKGPSSTDEFLEVLENSCFPSVVSAFGISLSRGYKCIPCGQESEISLATIEVDPDNIEIVEDSYRPGKLKVNFTDNSRNSFRYLSLTDLGFHEHAQDLLRQSRLEEINEFINRQDRVFLRLGLGRVYQPPGQPKGYWLQVNGIYTFPDFFEEIRCYNA